MEVYYKDEYVKLIQGDCLEVMDRIIEKGIKFDTIITDPPYGNIKNIGDNSNIKHGMIGKTEWDNDINITHMFERSEKLLR